MKREDKKSLPKYPKKLYRTPEELVQDSEAVRTYTNKKREYALLYEKECKSKHILRSLAVNELPPSLRTCILTSEDPELPIDRLPHFFFRPDTPPLSDEEHEARMGDILNNKDFGPNKDMEIMLERWGTLFEEAKQEDRRNLNDKIPERITELMEEKIKEREEELKIEKRERLKKK